MSTSVRRVRGTHKPTMHNIVLTGERNLCFYGTSLAVVTNRETVEKAGKSRWLHLEVWETAGGNYVFVRSHITQVEGEQNKIEGSYSSLIHEAPDFFGYSRLAKRLYERLCQPELAEVWVDDEIEAEAKA
jgi:hypothetical protein